LQVFAFKFWHWELFLLSVDKFWPLYVLRCMSHWKMNFTSSEIKIEREVVRIWFPNLNLVQYDQNFLLVMALSIGHPIKVENNTSKVEHRQFVRVCVEVDLTLLVVGKIWPNDHWHKVQCSISRNYTTQNNKTSPSSNPNDIDTQPLILFPNLLISPINDISLIVHIFTY
jgi:hypothetical protein